MRWRVSWRLKVDHSSVGQTVARSSTGQNPKWLLTLRGGSGSCLTSYIRWRVTTRLWRSKLRQIRTRGWTDLSCPGNIPRLGLMAAALGVRLAETVSERIEIPLSRHTLWTNNMDVIYWIQGHSRRLKSFVTIRVADIQRKSDPTKWRHLPGEQNPTDDATRGLDLKYLFTESRWF